MRFLVIVKSGVEAGDGDAQSIGRAVAVLVLINLWLVCAGAVFKLVPDGGPVQPVETRCGRGSGAVPHGMNG